jgi:threonine/homoserine/homoserine lactone efflux protein
MSIQISMAAFALATSISPGPVNIVALSTGARYGLGPGMRHVSGATIGFTLLLLLTGLGLHELLARWPALIALIRWAGIAFLAHLACKLALDDGALHLKGHGDGHTTGPTLRGAALLAGQKPTGGVFRLAGLGASPGGSAGDHNAMLVWQFTAIYFVICYASLACWACAGAVLSQYLQQPSRVRLFNRSLAALLAASAVYLLLDQLSPAGPAICSRTSHLPLANPCRGIGQASRPHAA